MPPLNDVTNTEASWASSRGSLALIWRDRIRQISTVGIPLILCVMSIPIMNTIKAGHPLSFIWPQILLFTPYAQMTRDAWESLVEFPKEVFEHKHIPIIPKAEFTMEKMKIATNNWRSPAIIRGALHGTKAMKNWHVDGYFASKFGDYQISVVPNTTHDGGLTDGRYKATVRDAFSDVINKPDKRLYVFFPIATRYEFDGLNKTEQLELQKLVNDMAVEDLDLGNVLWDGFGTKRHKGWVYAQILITQGSNTTDVSSTSESTGTSWHAAFGANWFALVHGRKRWYFLDPNWTPYLYGLKASKFTMARTVLDWGSVAPHLPIQYADLEAGDLMYNPHWQWHKIVNYPGLTIGAPLREVNMSIAFRNSALLSTLGIWNGIMGAFGLDGGYVGGLKPEQMKHWVK